MVRFKVSATLTVSIMKVSPTEVEPLAPRRAPPLPRRAREHRPREQEHLGGAQAERDRALWGRRLGRGLCVADE